MAFNPVQNFNEGNLAGQNLLKSQQQNQIRDLQNALAGQAGQGGFDATNNLDIQRLAAIDPSSAEKSRSAFANLSKERKKAYFLDAKEAQNRLLTGDIEGVARLFDDRKGDVLKLNGDTTQVDYMTNLLNTGQFEELREGLAATVLRGQEEGLLSVPEKDKLDSLPAETQAFNSLVDQAGLTPEEKKKAARIKLRLEAGAVGSSSQTISQDEALTQDVANSQAAIEGAKEGAKLEEQFKLKPKIAEAVAMATGRVAMVLEKRKEERSNAKALDVYNVSFSALAEALGNTYTGPLIGLMPAITSNSQMAQGAIAMVLPTLKNIFRSAGEGTFSEGDQKVLTDLVPTRSDKPATIKWKLNKMDNIIRTTLGSEQKAETEENKPKDQFSGFRVVR